MTSIMEIGQALVDVCRNGKEAEGLKTLYASDAVSVEAMTMPGSDSRETHGVEGIQGKHDWWNSSFEVHSATVDGPYPHGDDRFALIFDVDCTEKASGQRMPMKEVGVYTVAEGKITREEFFYPTGG